MNNRMQWARRSHAAMRVLATMGAAFALAWVPDAAQPPQRKAPGVRQTQASDLPATWQRELTFSGCDEVLRGPVCVLGAQREVSVWLAEDPAKYTLSFNDSLAEYATERLISGYRVTLAPSESGILEVALAGTVKLRLRLLRRSVNSEREAFERLRRAQDQAGMSRFLDTLTTSVDPSQERWTRRQRARLSIQQGHLDDARSVLESTIQQAFEAGELSAATDDVFALAFVLMRVGELESCHKLLWRWQEPLGENPASQVLFPQHLAMLARLEGDFTTALTHNARARGEAERLGAVRWERMIAREQASVLVDLGAFSAASAVNRQLLSDLDGETACVRANVWARQGWLEIQMHADGASIASDAVGKTLANAERAELECGDPEVILNGLLNQGLWALTQGDLIAATGIWRRIQQTPAPTSLQNQGWLLDFSARVALREGKLEEASSLFARELELGKSGDLMDVRVRALVGSGRVLDRADGKQAAAVRYEQAFEELLRAQRMAPLGELANNLLYARREAAAALIESLTDLGRTQAAFKTALDGFQLPLRRLSEGTSAVGNSPARLRLLANYRRVRSELDAAAALDWQRSSSELIGVRAARTALLQELREALERLTSASTAQPESASSRPPDDEMWLLPFPLSGARWRVFVANSQAVEVVNLTQAPLGQELAPVSAAIRRTLGSARRVGIFAFGASKHWNFRRIIADATSEQRSIPIVFRLSGAGVSNAGVDGNRASVVADTQGDLPLARQEGKFIQKRLNVPYARTLLGSQATAAGVLELLETSSWFHFAGHAELVQGESRLLLPNGQSLGAWEMLTTRQLPQVVMLSACDAGGSSEASFGASFNLATVLAARGASLVIAPTTQLNDAEALALQSEFYSALDTSRRLEIPQLIDTFWRVQERHASSGTAPAFELFVN